ncbi:MAG TPA: 2-oxoglutarate and iron-dependent oxygenase domain-containing protein [Acidocella sp.]|jgi:isopenicillin N synthase-like dioxygenase|nr:2-oxoglutarate and iron-dependent oxygenase domain-containing protein [Acidocella sp.]
MSQTIELDPALQAARLCVTQIPVIDVSPLRGAPGRAEMVEAIGRACREIGFFYAIGHGVAEARIAEVYAEAKRFFDLPVAEKEKIAIERSPCHRGWFRLGGENLDPAQQAEGDFKEGLKIGRDLPVTHERVLAGLPLHGPNQWADLPGWKGVMQGYYDEMVALGRKMMGAFAEALGLEAGFFDPWLGVTMTTLGALHYPPQHGRITEARIGAGAHTDYGCFTFLHQDAAGGLQVKRRDGLWIDAPPVVGSFVVNIGDMLERWTNGVFCSTPHRVVNVSGADRYSLPFFFDPDFYAPVECLPTCLAPGEVPRFKPTTAGAHMLEKIAESFEYAQKR